MLTSRRTYLKLAALLLGPLCAAAPVKAQSPPVTHTKGDSTFLYGTAEVKGTGNSLEGLQFEVYHLVKGGYETVSLLKSADDGSYSGMVPYGKYQLAARRLGYHSIYGDGVFNRDTVELHVELERDLLDIDCEDPKYDGMSLEGEKDGVMSYRTLSSRATLAAYARSKGFYTPDSLLNLIGPQLDALFPFGSWLCGDTENLYELYHDFNNDRRIDAVMIGGVPECLRFVHCFSVPDGYDCSTSRIGGNFAELCFGRITKDGFTVQFDPTESLPLRFEVLKNRIFDNTSVACGAPPLLEMSRPDHGAIVFPEP